MNLLAPQEYERMILSAMEDETVPRMVENWAAMNQGKQLRENNIPFGFTLRRQYGATSLKSTEPGHYQGGGYSITIKHDVKNVTVPTVEVLRQKNKNIFEGREQRNAFRAALLNDPVRVAQHIATINRTIESVNALRRAYVDFNATFDSVPGFVSSEIETSETYHPDRYAIKTRAGLDKLDRLGEE